MTLQYHVLPFFFIFLTQFPWCREAQLYLIQLCKEMICFPDGSIFYIWNFLVTEKETFFSIVSIIVDHVTLRCATTFLKMYRSCFQPAGKETEIMSLKYIFFKEQKKRGIIFVKKKEKSDRMRLKLLNSFKKSTSK
ncbi:hypothetical protein BDC45DRAFT_560157 [Circinella umbellata]|nr:hypothetical protein BDC45DRAFT_560157 [Circinella umbellata]